MTPYEALYGFSFPRLIDHVPGTTQVAAVDSILQSRQQFLTLLKQNLVDAQARIKKQSDLHRIEKVFKFRDWVYLRLQPYKHQSIAIGGIISFPLGFWSLQSFGEVAYRLDLLAESTIHPAFHVSCEGQIGQSQYFNFYVAFCQISRHPHS